MKVSGFSFLICFVMDTSCGCMGVSFRLSFYLQYHVPRYTEVTIPELLPPDKQYCNYNSVLNNLNKRSCAV